MPDTPAPSATAPRIEAVAVDRGWRLPGIANLHSHAFQRAMAGQGERRGGDGDSFWTWREVMYAMAARFTPESLHAVALQLYVEMLEAGYTTVCEFHYLHHAADGRAHAPTTAMSDALAAAAREAGIRLQLLPVLYMAGGFDGRALSPRQRRFGHDVDGYLALFEALRGRYQDDGVRVGCALHSLRAVPADAMASVLAALPDDARIHVHIAEQLPEVEECVALRGARPVRWLLDHAAVDPRWTLVHATHLDDGEVAGIAATGATVAICPTTEGNLGDGLFPLRAFLDAGGRWGIGSDSHVSVSPVEELRWLDYGQRLATHGRAIPADAAQPSPGAAMLAAVRASATDATGFDAGDDHLVLDADAPALAAATAEDVADRWLYAGNRPLVRDVVVAGRRVVADGRHPLRERAAAAFRTTLQDLLA